MYVCMYGSHTCGFTLYTYFALLERIDLQYCDSKSQHLVVDRKAPTTSGLPVVGVGVVLEV